MSDQTFSVDRRQFLQSSTLAAAATLAPALFNNVSAQESPSEVLNAGVIGTGRGMAHANAVINGKGVKLNYVCDVDQKRLDIAMKTVTDKGAKAQGITDFRRMLDDPKLDVVFIATCNHWHAPATILACSAGKHVYVEKPGSHNAREGELMVAAARKHKRVVQMGNQRRTWAGLREGIAKMKEGLIGNVHYARCWYDANRTTIGTGKPVPVPETLDYSMWQGPAPERPYLDNLVHYNWHWRWHWGGGELANNGIHSLDVARWGLGVEYPSQVSFLGGRYHFTDDQETPDTGAAVFHFAGEGNSPGKGITWDVSSCHPRRDEKNSFVVFYGDNGSMHLDGGSGYKFYDLKGTEIAKGGGGHGGEQDHIQNFLDCIKNGEIPNSEIGEGQKSTLLCHLGNISYKLGRMVKFDPATKQIVGDNDATALWGREYRKGWEPVV